MPTRPPPCDCLGVASREPTHLPGRICTFAVLALCLVPLLASLGSWDAVASGDVVRAIDWRHAPPVDRWLRGATIIAALATFLGAIHWRRYSGGMIAPALACGVLTAGLFEGLQPLLVGGGLVRRGLTAGAALGSAAQLAAILALIVWAALVLARRTPVRRRDWGLAAVATAIAQLGFVLVLGATAPGAAPDSGLSGRVLQFLPLAALLLAATAVMPALWRRVPCEFTRALWLSLVPRAAAQLCLILSDGRSLDLAAASAAWLTAVATILPLYGLAMDALQAYHVERLRVEERFLRHVIDAIPLCIYVRDPHGRVLLVNQTGADLLGRPRESLLGLHPHELYPSPELAASVTAEDRQVRETMTPSVREHELITADGQAHVMEVMKQPVFSPDGQSTLVLGVARDVTELRRVQAALQASEARARSYIDSAPNGVFVSDPTGRYIDVNRAACAMTGFSREELLRMRVLDLVTPRERVRGAEAFQHLLATGQLNVELTCLSKDGMPFDMSVDAARLEDGSCLAFVADVTERRGAIEALRASEALIHSILDGAQDAFLSFDANGAVRHWNAAAERLFGWTATEAVGRSVTDTIFSVDDSAGGATILAGLWEHVTGPADRQLDTVARHRDGHDVPVRMTLWSVNKDGAALFNAFLKDRTELLRSQREKDHMEVQLRHAQKLEAIGQLAAGIAHEINTPIQYVGDNLRFLSDAFSELIVALAHQDRFFADARAGRLAAGTIQQVADELAKLDLAYLETEVPSAVRQSLDGVGRVAAIVRAMKEFSHPGAAMREPADLNRALLNTITVSRNEWKYVAEIETALDPDLPAVPCLPGELNQAFLNLIVNAGQAIAETHARDAAGKGRIRIATRRDGDQVEIRIEDDGPGIPAAIRDRIFDPFFTTKPVGQGSGQGLAIAHAVIVKKHAGTLTCESEPGAGAAFVIRLPLEATHREPAEERHEEAHPVRG